MLVAIVDKLFLVYMMMLFVRILGSWFPEYQAHPAMRFVAFYTDPYLNFFRGIIPALGMIDISPIIGFFCLGILEQIIKSLVA